MAKQNRSISGHDTALLKSESTLKELGLYDEYLAEVDIEIMDYGITRDESRKKCLKKYLAKIATYQAAKKAKKKSEMEKPPPETPLPCPVPEELKETPKRPDYIIDLSKDDWDDMTPSTPLAVINWIFENMDVADVKPHDAPSPGAWSLYIRIKNDPEMQREFYKTQWMKTLPSKNRMEEAMGALVDDGRKQLKHLDKLISGIQGAEEERSLLKNS